MKEELNHDIDVQEGTALKINDSVITYFNRTVPPVCEVLGCLPLSIPPEFSNANLTS